MAAMSDFLENKIIDWLLRGQAIGVTGATAAAGTGPANVYIALLTAAPSDAGGGTEASYTGYARATIVSSLANWAGTQSAASTVASSGTIGTTSNNAIVTIGTMALSGPTVVTHIGIYDAVSAGNLLFWSALTASKTINNGDPAPTFAAAALTLQIDN